MNTLALLDPPGISMKPRLCKSCGALAVMPPQTMDLATPVSCSGCGAPSGTWRAVETSSDASGHADTRPAIRRPRSDLRTDSRSRTLLGAQIVFNNRCSTIDCTVRDLSPTGAKVLVSPHVAIPDEFDLNIPQSQRKHRARIMWRDADSCGVRFIKRTA
jgi:hypothetical protein